MIISSAVGSDLVRSPIGADDREPPQQAPCSYPWRTSIIKLPEPSLGMESMRDISSNRIMRVLFSASPRSGLIWFGASCECGTGVAIVQLQIRLC